MYIYIVFFFPVALKCLITITTNTSFLQQDSNHTKSQQLKPSTDFSREVQLVEKEKAEEDKNYIMIINITHRHQRRTNKHTDTDTNKH